MVNWVSLTITVSSKIGCSARTVWQICACSLSVPHTCYYLRCSLNSLLVLLSTTTTVIPLAKKLKDVNVFGVSSDECLNCALQNRAEWQEKGKAIVEEMMEQFPLEGEVHI